MLVLDGLADALPASTVTSATASVVSAAGSVHTMPSSPATSVSESQRDGGDSDGDGEDDATVTVSALDDVFGSTPPTHDDASAALSQSPAAAEGRGHTATTDPSDIPFVRRQHVTEGYRAGIITAKQAHLQRGFDEGYPFGAKLGLRAGVVKGVLEGLLRSGGSVGDDERLRRDVLAAKLRAEEELEVSRVFAAAADAVAPAGAGGGAPAPPAPPHLALHEAGDQVVMRWEDTVNAFLARAAAVGKHGQSAAPPARKPNKTQASDASLQF
ncbi:Essential protein Yae1, N terminal [Ascosphaera acerosa]|nr:Essential protein Yae1, N terminal [Ascosphaera acerosa]